MSRITDIHNPWRDAIMPASYRTARFHVEVGTRESGRRLVVHEFPKRDLPWSEDMGRATRKFTVRAYCIAHPYDSDALFQRDYRVPRDLLMNELEKEGSGDLQLPFLGKLSVVVQSYRLTEEQKSGGYCVFDIVFVEAGNRDFVDENTRNAIINATNALRDRVVDVFNGVLEKLNPFQ